MTPPGWHDPLPEWVPMNWWIWLTPVNGEGKRLTYFREMTTGRITWPRATVDEALSDLNQLLETTNGPTSQPF